MKDPWITEEARAARAPAPRIRNTKHAAHMHLSMTRAYRRVPVIPQPFRRSLEKISTAIVRVPASRWLLIMIGTNKGEH